MAFFKCTVLFCSLMFADAAGIIAKEASEQAQTPLGKVLEVITKIRRDVVKEGVVEEDIYKNFACFCKDKTARLEKMVIHHANKIDLTSATIAEETAEDHELHTENSQRSADHESMSAQKVSNEQQLAEENTNWQNTEAEFNNNKQLIKKALKAMKESKDRVSSSFLQASEVPGIAKYLAIADAMGLITAPKQKAIAASLLQGATPALLQGGAHENPLESYGYHGGSNDVIDLVESLMGQMQDLQNTQQDEHAKAVFSFKDMIKVLGRQIGENEDRIRSNKRSQSRLAMTTAQARQDLIENDQDLDETDHVLKVVTAACTSRAEEYDERTSNREAELKALTTALACLGKARPAADRQRIGAGGWNGLLQASPVSNITASPQPNHTQAVEAKPAKTLDKVATKPSSFLQELATHNHAPSFLQRAELSSDDLKKKALDVILSEGLRVNSLMLTSLASRSGNDPFEKVKQLISDLRFRLESEASQETTKKVFCDEELKKARHERDTRREQTQHINMLLVRLDARRDALKESIKYNIAKALEIGDSIQKVFTDASQLNKDQLKQFQQQKEARDELKMAIATLKKYYSGAAKAADKSLLQAPNPNRAYRAERKDIHKESQERNDAHEERVEEREERERKRIGALDGDVPASGRLGSMGDALALLETVASDFDREIGNLEGDMSEDYKQLVKANDILKAQKMHAEELAELDKQELESAKVETKSKMEDLKTAQNLLDDALIELEELKPTCIDTGMSYKERVEKRETEMEALTKALCILGETSKKYGCPQSE